MKNTPSRLSLTRMAMTAGVLWCSEPGWVNAATT